MKLKLTKKQAKKDYSIYIHTNKLNDKKYIGITRQTPERRWQKGKGYEGTYFGNAISKYGWDGFKHEIIMQGLTKEEACNLEITLIRVHDTTNKEKGYNLSEGGQTGDNMRTLTGINHPNHKRVKMIDTKTNEVLKVFDTQTSAASIMGFNRKGITKACQGINKTYMGYVWEYADIDYIKPIHKGCGNYVHDKIKKPVIMIDEDGEHRFESVKEASEYIGVRYTTISRYLSGSRKDSKRRWYFAS